LIFVKLLLQQVKWVKLEKSSIPDKLAMPLLLTFNLVNVSILAVNMVPSCRESSPRLINAFSNKVSGIAVVWALEKEIEQMSTKIPTTILFIK